MPHDLERYADIATQAASEGLYSIPTAAIDFEDWARDSSWTPETAVALSHGLEPHDLNWPAIEEQRDKSKLAHKLWRARERVRDVQACGDLTRPHFRPYLYLYWVEARALEVPPQLIEALKKCGLPPDHYRQLYFEEMQKTEPLKQALAELAKGQRKEGDLSKVEANSLFELIVGMAEDKFGYDRSNTGNSHAPAAIAAALLRRGLSMDPGTVLKWLRIGAARIPKDRDDAAHKKSDSGSV